MGAKMNKWRYAVGAVLLAVLCGMTSCGQENTAEPPAAQSDYAYTVMKDHVRIDQYTGDDENVVIPEKIDGLPVTVIGGDALFRREQMKSVVIPDSVDEIGPAAFYRCYALNRITIPSGVSKIGSNPFFRCSSLQEIAVDAGNDHYTAENGVLFNKEMTALIAFPEGLKIDSYSVPETVETIADGAFGYHPACKSFRFLNKDIAFPEGALTAHDYDLTLFGYVHSSAQAYAEKYGIKFAELQE